MPPVVEFKKNIMEISCGIGTRLSCFLSRISFFLSFLSDTPVCLIIDDVVHVSDIS